MREGISIIIPYYCGNKYLSAMAERLKRCIDQYYSVFNEKIEIIIVNDSPWEKIEEELLTAVKGYYKIITNNKNSGIHQTRVNGIKESSQTYILMLDQDDKIEDTWLLSQYKIMYGSNIDLLIANGVRRYSDKDVPIFRNLKWLKDARTFAPYVALGNVIASPGQCLIRKSAIPGFWLNNILKENCADDMYLWMLMLGEKRHVEVNPDILYIHVFTGNNFSADEMQTIKSERKVIQLLRNSGLVQERYLKYYSNRLARREKYFFKIKNRNLAQIYYVFSELRNRGKLIELRLCDRQRG